MRNWMSRLSRRCCCFCLGVLLTTSSIAAQTVCSGIEGRLTTSDGWVIPGANITFVGKTSKVRLETQTNENGEYTFCLAEGLYNVLAESMGFRPAKRKSIEVKPATRHVIDFVMKRGKPVSSH